MGPISTHIYSLPLHFQVDKTEDMYPDTRFDGPMEYGNELRRKRERELAEQDEREYYDGDKDNDQG